MVNGFLESKPLDLDMGKLLYAKSEGLDSITKMDYNWTLHSLFANTEYDTQTSRCCYIAQVN